MGWRADVPEIMAGLDVLVLAFTGTEGVPEVVLQAMPIGLPVVGSDIGGVIEVLAPDGAGVIVPPRDPAVLVSGIRCLLRAPARREEMGRLGRECVRRWFSHDKMVDETLALYEEAISSRGGRR